MFVRLRFVPNLLNEVLFFDLNQGAVVTYDDWEHLAHHRYTVVKFIEPKNFTIGVLGYVLEVQWVIFVIS